MQNLSECWCWLQVYICAEQYAGKHPAVLYCTVLYCTVLYCRFIFVRSSMQENIQRVLKRNSFTFSFLVLGLIYRSHWTVKLHTDIINFACMTSKFVRISASLSALCTNFYLFDIGIAFLAKFYPILM